MKRKIFTLLVICTISLVAYAQNIQVHYDFRNTLYGKNVAPRNFVTATFEMFKPDALGSTFMFVDFDYTTDRTDGAYQGNLGLVYGEIARDFKVGAFPLMPHIEFNGGLGNGFVINNAYLLGASYPFKVGDFFMSACATYKLNAFEKVSHDAQLTFVWGGNLLDNKLTVSGFVDLWSENKVGPNSNGKKIIFLSEPQLWYNFNEHISAGSEVELSYNFVNGYKESKFYAVPTLALKYNF